MSDLTAIGAVVAVVHALVELIKFLIGKISTKKVEDEVQIIKNHVVHLRDQHDKFDVDGRPIWYFPISLIDTLEKIAESQTEMAHNQEKMTDVLERVTGILDRIERRQEIFHGKNNAESSI